MLGGKKKKKKTLTCAFGYLFIYLDCVSFFLATKRFWSMMDSIFGQYFCQQIAQLGDNILD